MSRILILGASSGIGKATAILASEKGYSLNILARRKSKLKELQRALDTDVTIHAVDATDENNVKNAIEMIDGDELVGVVHCIGKGGKANIENFPPSEWEEIFDINLHTAYTSLYYALPYLRDTDGSFVLISSAAGKINLAGFAPYCSSKHALTSLQKVASRELDIAVKGIHPFRVDTEFFDRYEEDPATWQMLSPFDIAQVILTHVEKKPLKRQIIRIKNFLKRILKILRLI